MEISIVINGETGSGKTTLMHMIASMIFDHNGVPVCIDDLGETPAELDIHSLDFKEQPVKIRTALMPQDDAIDQYQLAANATCSPMTGAQLARLAECRKAIGYMVDQARPALMLADDIKKYIYYGKVPGRDIPHLDTSPAGDCMRSQEDVDLIHAIIGILSEGEELLMPLKILGLNPPMSVEAKEAFLLNLKEEFGDVPWYTALAARGLKRSLSEIFAANIRKLNDKAAGRYKKGYTNEAAINRDTAAELPLLEDTEPAEFVPGMKLPRESHQRMVVADPPKSGLIPACEHDAHPQRCEICATGME